MIKNVFSPLLMSRYTQNAAYAPVAEHFQLAYLISLHSQPYNSVVNFTALYTAHLTAILIDMQLLVKIN